MTGIRPVVTAACLFVALAAALPARAQSGDNILIVINALSQASEEIGTYYATKRSVPSAQVLRLPLPTTDEIDRREFEAKIEAPLAKWLTTHAAQDRISYIVLIKHVPLRIAGNGGQNGTVASVDSELTLLYRKLIGIPVPSAGSIKNPYFIGEGDAGKSVRFSHRSQDIYLVTRLDGYTVPDVKALIDRGLTPARQGTIVLDGKLELRETVGNKWLAAAATNVKKTPGWGDKVVNDAGQTTLTEQQNVIGYYSWGSNAVAATTRHYGHKFLPGAIGGEFVSTDARTFNEPPADWPINDTKNPFGGSHQSLIGDLIRDGITGVAGHVAEPYLNATIRPDLLFPAYLKGFNLAEAFYLAMPSLSWQTVVVGDPLCAISAAASAAPGDLNPAIDPATNMPLIFSGHRVAVMTAAGINADAAKLALKADVAMAHEDRAGARESLERATALDEGLIGADFLLASMAEQDKNWDEAIRRYQRIVAKSPNNPPALNNLAYALAIHKNDPQSALPLASRAYVLSERDPMIADTLAWVHHLLGRDSTAEPIIALALQRRTNAADIPMHAAFIFAANGKVADAERYLNDAIKLDPALEQRADVQELRAKLRAAK